MHHLTFLFAICLSVFSDSPSRYTLPLEVISGPIQSAAKECSSFPQEFTSFFHCAHLISIKYGTLCACWGHMYKTCPPALSGANWKLTYKTDELKTIKPSDYGTTDADGNKTCMYRYGEERNAICQIEFQKEWRCTWQKTTNGLVGRRDGIITGYSLGAGATCKKNYPNLAYCREYGTCSERDLDVCKSQVNKLNNRNFAQSMYARCYYVQPSLTKLGCTAMSWDYQDARCRMLVRQSAIVCAPRVSSSGSLFCECTNLYNKLYQRMSKKEDLNISLDSLIRIGQHPCAPEDSSQEVLVENATQQFSWTCTRNTSDICLCHENQRVQPATEALSYADCQIDWHISQREGRNSPIPDIKVIGKTRRAKGAARIGLLQVLQSQNGRNCSDVYGGTVECVGQWCIIMNDVQVPAHEVSACSVLAKNMSGSCGSDCWGCFTCPRCSDAVCGSYPAPDGGRRCLCFLPESSSCSLSPEERLTQQSWLCGDYSRSANLVFGSGEYVPYPGMGALNYCYDGSKEDCDLEWDNSTCESNVNNNLSVFTSVSIGQLRKLAGAGGSCGGRRVQRTFRHQENIPLLCQGFECKWWKFDESCGPKRRKTSSNCYCSLGWKHWVGSKGKKGFTCGEEYQGCCNPHGESTGAHCPTHFNNWPQPDDCKEETTYVSCTPISVERFGLCAPWWYVNKNSPCPYGKGLPGSVTLPTSPSFGQMISVVYGYVPYAIALAVGVEFLCKRNSRALSFLLFFAIASFLGEVVFKNMVQEPRPERSCLHSCGMPSGHSSLSVGYYVLMFLDSVWRLWSDSKPNRRSTLQAMEPDQERLRYFKCCRVLFQLRSAVPMLSSKQISVQCFIIWVSFWFWLLLPVPISRVVLSDHSGMQVFVGSLIGAIEGVIWFGFIMYFERRNRQHFGKRFCYILHDYILPDRSQEKSVMALENEMVMVM